MPFDQQSASVVTAQELPGVVTGASALAAPAIEQSPALAKAGIGTVTLAGSNYFTATQMGPDVLGVAALANILVQALKQPRWLNQNIWAPIILVVITVGAFMLMTQGDFVQAIPKGGFAALQAAITYASQKATGFGPLSAAAPMLSVEAERI